MAKRKILIIDDDVSLCELLSDFLTDQGYRVITSYRGLAGLKKAKDEQPHLIVLDIDMPDMTGFEVCKKLREVPYLHHTPVIMLTARSEESSEVKGFEAGVDDYITKPFKPKGLLARIEGLSLAEVAERMNRSQGAVAQLLWRALRALRDRFGDTESFHLPERRLEDRGGGNGT